MKRILACIAFVSAAFCSEGFARGPRTVDLTIHPAKAAQPNEAYRLLPKPAEQTDCDAAALYRKAVEAMPNEKGKDPVLEWARMPIEEVPLDEAESELARFEDALKLVEEAGKCQRCQWETATGAALWQTAAGSELLEDLQEYRRLAMLICLKAKVAIAKGNLESALGDMRSGFSMAKNIGEGPTVTEGLVGIAIGALMLNPVNEFIQRPDSPSLYEALAALPKPLVDVNKALEEEMANIDSSVPLLARGAMKRQLEPAHARVRELMNRLDRDVAGLQCVEALRLYAAKHDGKFPNRLEEITEVAIPVSPAAQKAFAYKRSDSEAILEAPAGEADADDLVLYKLKLVEPGKAEDKPAGEGG